MKKVNQILAIPFVLIIKLYQVVISPLIGPKCRYTPSCSTYGVEAFKKHGIFKGGWLTIKRIIKCNPWGGHGHDPGRDPGIRRPLTYLRAAAWGIARGRRA